MESRYYTSFTVSFLAMQLSKNAVRDYVNEAMRYSPMLFIEKKFTHPDGSITYSGPVEPPSPGLVNMLSVKTL